jgi:drug/metabolite transporter (DMT)-like permease
MGAVYTRPLQGVLFLIMAVACFALLDTTVKVLSATVSVLLVVWFRYIFPGHRDGGLGAVHHRLAFAAHATPLPARLRGLLLLLTSTLGFASLIYMPVGEFTAIIMLTPLVVTLLAAVFLKERVNGLRWLLVLGGFGGALMVIQPTGQAIGWPVAIPLAMVLVYAAFQILTSRMARTENSMTMHFYTGWTGALLISLLLPWIWTTVEDGKTLVLLCLTGLFGTVGHFVLIQAFKRAPAATLAPYLYTQIGFALLAAGWCSTTCPAPRNCGASP